MAIREYAPSAQVVIDGRVYRSAGVNLHSHYETAEGGGKNLILHGDVLIVVPMAIKSTHTRAKMNSHAQVAIVASL